MLVYCARNHLARKGEQVFRQFFFVVNFKDAVAEDELQETLAGIRKRLAELLPVEQIRLYPLAAKQAVAAREEQDEAALEASGFAAFQRDMLQFLQSGERRQEKLARLGQQIKGLRQQLLEQIALQEQRVSIRAAETEKDFVRYTEEVLPLVLQRYMWQQADASYREDYRRQQKAVQAWRQSLQMFIEHEVNPCMRKQEDAMRALRGQLLEMESRLPGMSHHGFCASALGHQQL